MIIVNKIQCNKCKDIITSTHRHDFKWCSCREVAVDGGTDYLKRVGEGYKELSVDSSAPFEKIRENLYRNGTTLLKDMSNKWLINCIEYEKENRPDNPYLRYYKEELEYRGYHNIFIEEKNPIYDVKLPVSGKIEEQNQK